MRTWIRRILLVLLSVVFSSTFTFFVIRSMSGDPFTTLAQELRQISGLGQDEAQRRADVLQGAPRASLLREYRDYLGGVLRGDLGRSMLFRVPVAELIGSSLPWTLFVSSLALFLSFLLGTVLGLFCAWKRRSLLDPLVTVYDAVIGAIPPFVIGYLLLVLFSVRLRWFPARGNYASDVIPGLNPKYLASILYHAVLPVLTWVITTTGTWALGIKSAAVSVLGEDHMTAAHARGLGNRRIVLSYLGKNAILPQIALFAIQLGGMFSGSVLIENTFVYPGIGFYYGRAVNGRDYALMQGILLVITVAIVIANIVSDLVCSLLDPRIRE